MRITQRLCNLFSFLILLSTTGFSKSCIEIFSTFSEVKTSVSLCFYSEPKPLLSRLSITVSDYGEFRNFKVYESFYSEESSIGLYELQACGEIGLYFDDLWAFLIYQTEFINLYTPKLYIYYGGGIGISLGMFSVESKIRNLNLFLGSFNCEIKLSMTNEFLENFCLHFEKDNVSYPSLGFYSEMKLLEIEWLKLVLGAGVSVNFGPSLFPYRLKMKISMFGYELSSFFRFSQYIVETGMGVSYYF